VAIGISFVVEPLGVYGGDFGTYSDRMSNQVPVPLFEQAGTLSAVAVLAGGHEVGLVLPPAANQRDYVVDGAGFAAAVDARTLLANGLVRRDGDRPRHLSGYPQGSATAVLVARQGDSQVLRKFFPPAAMALGTGALELLATRTRPLDGLAAPTLDGHTLEHLSAGADAAG
jgi:hypothetical protein